MLSDKLIRLLKSFSRSQMIRFRKYLISPFFNENEKLVQLFDLIEADFQEMVNQKKELPKLEKKIVWGQLFGAASYKDAQLRRICSDLSREAMHFLSYMEFKRNPIDEQIYLLKSINEPNLSKHFVGVVRQAREFQQKEGYQKWIRFILHDTK